MPRDRQRSIERRTFWPRSSRPDLLGEVDFDRPCPNCGYNLRGLPEYTACPECGSLQGLNVHGQSPAWERRQTLGSYLAMVIKVIFSPHDTARLFWAPVRLDVLAARRFRRVGLIIATPSLCAVAFALTSAVIGAQRAFWCVPFDAAAILILLNAVSLDPIGFFRDKLSERLFARAEAMAYYASAPLALVPAQLVLLLVTYRPFPASDPGWLIAAAIHVSVLLAQLGLGTMLVAWLTYETMSISIVGAFAFTLGAASRALGTSAVLLLGVPVLVASIAARFGN